MKDIHNSSNRHQLLSHSIITYKGLSRNNHHTIQFYRLYISHIHHWITDLTTYGYRISSYQYSVFEKCLSNGSINTCERWRNSVRELWRNTNGSQCQFLSRILIIFDIFISHFLVKLSILNDRTDKINRFCKNELKICKRVEDIKRGMFSEVVFSNSSPSNE